MLQVSEQTTPKADYPDWISVDSHMSISPKYRALCLRCGQRSVGLLRECKAWAQQHAQECEGATCGVCGTKFPGRGWDECPTCHESADLGNRLVDAYWAGVHAKQEGLPPDALEGHTDVYKQEYERGYRQCRPLP